MRKKKNKRKEHPSRRSFSILGIIWGALPFSRTTHSQWKLGLEVQELELQLRGPSRACPLEVCGPVGHRLTQETPLRTVQPLCSVLIYPARSQIQRCFSPRGTFSILAGPLTIPSPGLRWLCWTPGWRYGPQEESRNTRARGNDDELCRVLEFSHLAAFIQLSNHPPLFPSENGKQRVFFKISPLAFSIPPLNANANVNTNTLIKNMWEENANLLFCNPPRGAHCSTETNKNAQHCV